MFRAIWFSVRFVLSTIFAFFAATLVYGAFQKDPAEMLLGASFCALFAAAPWADWNETQPASEFSAWLATVLAVLVVVAGAAVAAYSALDLLNLALALHENQPVSPGLEKGSTEFALRRLFGISLGVVVLLGGVIGFFKALLRLGIPSRGPLRAFEKDIPKPVLYALYTSFGVWMLLVFILPALYG